MAELISIRDVVDRDTVSIFGKAYDILSVEDLGPYEHAVVNRGAELAGRLASAKKPTAAQERQLDKALIDVLKAIVPTVPPATLKKLDRTQRANIVLVWVGRANQLAEEAAAATNPPRPRSRQTGRASSRGSKRSTAATRTAGGTRRRGS